MGKIFENCISEINKAYSRGDATEHTHRPTLKKLILTDYIEFAGMLDSCWYSIQGTMNW